MYFECSFKNQSLCTIKYHCSRFVHHIAFINSHPCPAKTKLPFFAYLCLRAAADDNKYWSALRGPSHANTYMYMSHVIKQHS